MLLMGGQACVFYGAAEFSRDLDLLVLADPQNLDRLHLALELLQAVSIAVPPFSARTIVNIGSPCAPNWKSFVLNEKARRLSDSGPGFSVLKC